MNDEQAFMRAIAQSPDDDGIRLQFADWLDQRRDPRGEFIRIQCALANPQTPIADLAFLRRREQELLSQHGASWESKLRQLGAEIIDFHRGLPSHVLLNASDFRLHADQLFNLAPIEVLSLRQLATRKDFAFLASCPHLLRLRSLDLSGNPLPIEGVTALVQSPHFQNLNSLDLTDDLIGAQGMLPLAKSPFLSNLTSLGLAGNFIGPDGARALAESPHLTNITTLDLDGNGIADEGAEALARSPHLETVRTLNLTENWIGPRGARALAESPHLRSLIALELSKNSIGDEGAQALALSPHLKTVRTLNLTENRIGPRGARAVADSRYLGKGTTLLGEPPPPKETWLKRCLRAIVPTAGRSLS